LLSDIVALLLQNCPILQYIVKTAYGDLTPERTYNITPYLLAIKSITGCPTLEVKKIFVSPNLEEVCQRFYNIGKRFPNNTKWPKLSAIRPSLLLDVLREKASELLNIQDDEQFMSYLNDVMPL
jgi:hypothetical protein